MDLANWKATKEVLKDVGPVDLLVNNAALAILEPLEKVTEEHFDRYKHILAIKSLLINNSCRMFAVNVKAVFNLTQLVVENIKSRNSNGAIVNISSQASMAGLQDHTVYCATKGAVDSFTRATALEVGPYNIRINSVNPTIILTDMGRLGWSDPKKALPMLEKIPLKRSIIIESVNQFLNYFMIADLEKLMK